MRLWIDMVTIQGWLDIELEGGIYRDGHIHMYTASIISISTYNACEHMHKSILPTLYHAERF